MVSQLYLSSPLHSNDGDFQSKSKHTNIIVTLIEIHFNPACEKNALYIKKRFHFLRACALYKKVISFSSRSVSMKNHFRILKWFFICKVAFRNRNHFFISHRFQETRITFLYPTCFPKPKLLFISHMLPETRITSLYPTCFPKPELLFYIPQVSRNQNYFLYPRGLTKLKSLFVFRWVAKNLRCCRLFPTLSG